MAAVDYFLKLDGITGESTDDKLKDHIEVMSWSLGAAQSGSSGSGTGGGGTGKVKLQDISITKSVDKSSPILFEHCCGGDHISKGTIFCRKAGKGAQQYLLIHLTDIVVTSHQTSAGGGDDQILPQDQLTLNFGKIEFEYKIQNKDGTLGAATKKGWDAKANKSV
jgi:type VI secretion system secreted protein Hcp